MVWDDGGRYKEREYAKFGHTHTHTHKHKLVNCVFGRSMKNFSSSNSESFLMMMMMMTMMVGYF